MEATNLTDSLTIFRSMTALDNAMKGYIWQTGADEATWYIMIDIAMALAAVLGILMVAGMAYRMMAQGKELDILRLFRPLAVLLVLSNWYLVTLGLYQIAGMFEDRFRRGYERNAAEATALWRQRNARQDSLVLALDSIGANAEFMKKLDLKVDEEAAVTHPDKRGYEIKGETGARQEAVRQYLSAEAPEMTTELDQERMMAESYINNMQTKRDIESVIKWVGEIIWQTAVYFIFLLKNILLCVLVWFGPLFFAAMLLDAWKDEWLSWAAKLVSVGLYGTAAYMIMSVCTRLVIFALDEEMDNLHKILQDENLMYMYIYQGGTGWTFTMSMTFLSQVIGAMALFMVPEFVTYFIPAGMAARVGHMLNGMTAAVRNTVTAPAKAAVDVAKTAAATVTGTGALAAAGDKETGVAASGSGVAKGTVPPGVTNAANARKSDALYEKERKYRKTEEDLHGLKEKISSGKMTDAERKSMEERYRKAGDDLRRLEQEMKDENMRLSMDTVERQIRQASSDHDRIAAFAERYEKADAAGREALRATLEKERAVLVQRAAYLMATGEVKERDAIYTAAVTRIDSVLGKETAGQDAAGTIAKLAGGMKDVCDSRMAEALAQREKETIAAGERLKAVRESVNDVTHTKDDLVKERGRLVAQSAAARGKWKNSERDRLYREAVKALDKKIGDGEGVILMDRAFRETAAMKDAGASRLWSETMAEAAGLESEREDDGWSVTDAQERNWQLEEALDGLNRLEALLRSEAGTTGGLSDESLTEIYRQARDKRLDDQISDLEYELDKIRRQTGAINGRSADGYTRLTDSTDRRMLEEKAGNITQLIERLRAEKSEDVTPPWKDGGNGGDGGRQAFIDERLKEIEFGRDRINAMLEDNRRFISRASGYEGMTAHAAFTHKRIEELEKLIASDEKRLEKVTSAGYRAGRAIGRRLGGNNGKAPDTAAIMERIAERRAEMERLKDEDRMTRKTIAGVMQGEKTRLEILMGYRHADGTLRTGANRLGRAIGKAVSRGRTPEQGKEDLARRYRIIEEELDRLEKEKFGSGSH